MDSSITWTKQGPPVTQQDIEQFLQRLHERLEERMEAPLEELLVLPEDYAAMLLRHNGGVPSHPVLRLPPRRRRLGEVLRSWLPLPVPPGGDEYRGLGTSVEIIFSLGHASARDLRSYAEATFDEVPPNSLLIGDTSGGNFLFMPLTGRFRGRIYWKDHECLDPWQGVHEVAPSFTVLLSLLLPEPEKYRDPIETLGAEGTPDDLRVYLVEGGTLTALSQFGRTVGQECGRHGNLFLLKYLVAHGQNIDGALHLAALNGHMAVLRYLIEEAGVDVNSRDMKGRTALTCAFMNRTEVIAYLTQHGGVKESPSSPDPA